MQTRAERSGYRETSRHADVMEFIRALSHPGLQIQTVGTSPEGREIPLLVFGEAPDPARPSVLVINNIHAGEVEGKEASLMLARELASGEHPAWMRDMTLLILPLFNIDGNERIDPSHRALNTIGAHGQIGPETGVGTRTTAQGHNLNRDYMKVEAPEMRILNEKIFYTWKPVLTIDCHTTNGSLHAYDLTYGTCMNPAAEPGPMSYVAGKMLPEITRRLFDRVRMRTQFYGNWRDEHNPETGWETYSHLPRYGSNYRGLTGMMDILSEVYSYLPFHRRVQVNREFLIEVLDYCSTEIGEMKRIVDAARAGRRPSIPIRARLSDQGRDLELLRREFSVTAEAKAGYIRYSNYQPGRIEKVRARYFGTFEPTRLVDRPFAYAVPPGHEHILEILRFHDVRFEKIEADRNAQVETHRIRSMSSHSGSDIGTASKGELQVETETGREEKVLPKGSALIPMDQPQGNLAAYLLEPESDDGLATWGCFENLKDGALFPVVRVIRTPVS